MKIQSQLGRAACLFVLLPAFACSQQTDENEAQAEASGSTSPADAAPRATARDGGAPTGAVETRPGAPDAGSRVNEPADAASSGHGPAAHDAGSSAHDGGNTDARDPTGQAATDGGVGKPSKGCGKTSPRLDAKQQLTLQVGGKTRYYLAYVPSNYDAQTPLPLLFVLHGKDMNDYWAANAQDGFKLIEASKDTALLVFPQGSGDVPKNERQWGNITSDWDVSAGGADQAFLEALRGYVEDNYCIDTSRRFFTGFSMGGWMTETFACEHADLFRAFAPVSGWGPGGIETGHGTAPACKNTAPVSILITQGTTDNIVTPVNGEHSRDFWLERDACSKSAAPMPAYAGCVSYTDCSPALSVHYCTHTGGHSVPSGSGARIWAFFSSFR